MVVLDHGYIELVEHWGSDEKIIEAARMSTNKGFLGWGDNEKPGDERLLRYLWTHKHHTPFEMAGLTVEVQAPIFVFREWQRHRTQSYNELSARYTALPDLMYVPSIQRLMEGKQSNANKQGSATGITEAEAAIQQSLIRETAEHVRRVYLDLLERGLSRELARVIVPVGQFSRMRASANLRNWLSFLTLRTEAGAQWEIRQYAEALATIVGKLFPRTYDLWSVDESRNN